MTYKVGLKFSYEFDREYCEEPDFAITRIIVLARFNTGEFNKDAILGK